MDLDTDSRMLEPSLVCIVYSITLLNITQYLNRGFDKKISPNGLAIEVF